MALVCPRIFSSASHQLPFSHLKHHFPKPSFRVSCLSAQPEPINATESKNSRPQEYQPGIFDNLFLNLFRNKMVQEVGWDSEKPGYNGLIEVANRLMMGRSNSETKEAAVRILRSLFPPLLLELYRMLITPIGGGKVAALMVGKLTILAVIMRAHFVLPSKTMSVSCAIEHESSSSTFDFYDLFALYFEARVTALSCQWLMGSCKVNSINLRNGSSMMSGVFVERCKYLEESKCVGICINTCKLPTQAFFKDEMGVPLLMEPNFSDYSCQFNFGVLPPMPEDDSTLKEPCLDICPNARRRKEITTNLEALKCPKS